MGSGGCVPTIQIIVESVDRTAAAGAGLGLLESLQILVVVYHFGQNLCIAVPGVECVLLFKIVCGICQNLFL